MAYNEALADKIRKALTGKGSIKEQKMFGGLAFLVNGKMGVTIRTNQVMCRVDPALHDQLLRQKDCSTVVMRGRKYTGYLHIDGRDFSKKNEKEFWIRLVLEYNTTLQE